MTDLLRRLGAYLLEPADPAAPAPSLPPPPSSPPPPPTPTAPPMSPSASVPTPSAARPIRAVVLGAPAHVPSVAAACAGELRARTGAATALVCLWRPGPESADDDGAGGASAPAGATTPAARRLAAALEQDNLAATACGRLTWLALPDEPDRAVAAVRRALPAVPVPVVIAVAGPRPAALEPVLAVADVGLAVLPPDAEETLRALALEHLPGTLRRLVAPLPPGPPRWAALAGLARLRSLPEVEAG